MNKWIRYSYFKRIIRWIFTTSIRRRCQYLFIYFCIESIKTYGGITYQYKRMIMFALK